MRIIYAYCCFHYSITSGHVKKRSCLCFVVCTCVVHKRCHQNVVTKCPKEKDAGVDSSLVSTTAAVVISIVIGDLVFIFSILVVFSAYSNPVQNRL